MRVLLCQHVTDRIPDLDLSPNSLYRHNNHFPVGGNITRFYCTVKPLQKLPLSKRPKIGFQVQLSLNAGQRYCRMLPLEHSAILSTFIKLLFVIKIFVLSISEWPFNTGFTVL